jgi:hypothetical protein
LCAGTLIGHQQLGADPLTKEMHDKWPKRQISGLNHAYRGG